jgi:hypothetical protein
MIESSKNIGEFEKKIKIVQKPDPLSHIEFINLKNRIKKSHACVPQK